MQRGQAGKARDVHALALDVDGQRIVEELAAHDTPEAGKMPVGAERLRLQLEAGALAGGQREADSRVGHGEALDDFRDRHVLGPPGLQELEARRRRREQLAHLHTGAGVERGGPHRLLGAAIDDDLVAARVLAPARLDGQARDGADGGQRLAAEAEGGDVEQVLAGKLGGGVPFHGECQVGRAHPLAVVGDADQRQAAGSRHHLDLARAGIESVLGELLDHATGTLDHLAGGDAVDGLGTELADGHGAQRGSDP